MTGLELALVAVLLAALIALTVIDARTYQLPDVITLPLIVAGIGAAWLQGEVLWLHLLGAGIGYLTLVAIEKAYERARGREGLGRGDAKLFAAGGAWCGALGLPLILLAGSISALFFAAGMHLTGRKISAETAVAFGPFLSFGIALVYILDRLDLMGPFGL